MSSRFILPFSNVGSGIKPSSGAKLFFFKVDGVTPKDTFSDQLSTPTANTNPVIADSTGVFGDIYIEGAYKVTLQDKNGSQIFGLAQVISTGAATGENIGIFTLADAVANVNATEGQIVQITDRADGQFEYKTGQTPNTFNIVAADIAGLDLVLRSESLFNIKQFGAVGDGAADDTPPTQAALDAAKAVVQAIGVGVDQVTASVFVPAGSYLITGVTMGEGTMLYGEGQNVSMFRTVGSDLGIIMGATGTLFSGSWIIDIGVQGDDTTAGSIGILALGQVRNCGILRVFVLECDTLIKWDEAFATHLRDSHLRGAGSYCLDIINGSHSVIDGCRFDVAGEHCVRINGEVNETLDINFKHCSFQSAQKSGLIGTDIGSITIKDCDFESNNKIDSLTHADLRLVVGSANRTNTIHNIDGGFWSTGSSPGGNHVGISIEQADTVNLRGVHIRGNTFNNAINVGAAVKRLNLEGNFFQSITAPVVATASTIVTDTDIEGSMIRNSNLDVVASANSRQDVFLLRNEAASAGINSYGASIAATASGGGTNRRTAIVAKQTGSDSDQMGWAFFTHPSASDAVISEELVLNHLGEMELGGTGGPKVINGAGTPEAAVTAPIGSTFHRSDGGAGTSFYVKESGAGNTGWVAK